MQLVNTTGNFGDTVLISGSGNQYFDISEVRFGGVNGVASEFQVVNPNLISAKVPSFNSIESTGQRDKWKNNCYPSPLLVISETRGISGFASGASGNPINFTPIPQIEKFTPTTGISGTQVSVKGDGFLGLTGLAIENISGYSNLTGLSSVVTGHYQLSGSGFGSDSVYLDFSVVNNTGLNFNLPSGNFDGNIRVFGTGVSSKLSFARVQPNIEVTGFWPPIGESGQACVISGKYFFDELMHYATGEFENGDGTYTTGSGFLVSFEGNNATGVFIKISGSGIEENTMLSGTIPVHASSGPVKILKNIKTISLNESGYYNNTGVYFLQPPDPVITGLRAAGTVVAEVEFIGILETITGLSGISTLTGSSSTNSKSGFAFFGPKAVTGFYDQTNLNIPITPQYPNSGFATETNLEVDLANTSSDVNTSVDFLGENLFQSGVSGNLLSGYNEKPIITFYEPLGPNIDECLDYFNAGSGHLSGCEQAYLLYYSGHHKYLDITSPYFKPELLKCFITNQAMNSGIQGLTGFCSGGSGEQTVTISGSGYQGGIDLFITDRTTATLYPANGVPDLNTLQVGQTGNFYYTGDSSLGTPYYFDKNGVGSDSPNFFTYLETGTVITAIDKTLHTSFTIRPATGQLFSTGIFHTPGGPFGWGAVTFSGSGVANDPKCDDEDINQIIVNQIPPNIDIYSTSLGRPFGPVRGKGPSQLSSPPPNTFSSIVPDPNVISEHGRRAATTHLGGTGGWPYGTGTIVNRPCNLTASRSGYFAGTTIPDTVNSRYSNLNIKNQPHLKGEVIPLTKEPFNSMYTRVMIAYPPKPASNIGAPTKAGYERISLVSEPKSLINRNFRIGGLTPLRSYPESNIRFSSTRGSKNPCVDGNGNPLRGPLRSTPIINMGSPTNPGRIEIGGPRPIASPTPGIPNLVGGIPRGNASPTNSVRQGTIIPISMSPPPKTNVTSTLGVGISNFASRAQIPRGGLVSVTGPIIGQQLNPITVTQNPNFVIISCLAFPNEISTQGIKPQNPVQIPPPINPIGTAPIPTTTAGINPLPITATVPVLPPAVVRPIGPTIPPASNYPPKGTPSTPIIPPPITIQTTGVNRITSICD